MNPIISSIIAVVLVLLVVKIFFKSTKAIIGFLINTVIGFVILWVLNLFGVGITLNWISAAIVGFFGVPGILIVLLLQFVFHIL